MTQHEAPAYLDSLVNYERTHQPQAMRGVPLERMRALCGQIGNPQRRFRSILVAGTNGKGSTCAMIYAILRAARLRVGLYTSPHLHDVRERIRVTVNGEWKEQPIDWIGEQEWASVLGRVREASARLSQTELDGPPTYFEIVTAAAFVCFAERRVEVAVLEVGLGGRLDATNVVEPVVSIIGPIGLDHMDVLGESLAAIAAEKAGIIKPNGVVLSAAQPPEAAAVIRETANSQRCRLFEVGRELSATILSHDPQGMRLTIRSVRGEYQDVTLSLVGRHQAENAALAVAAIELLSDTGAPHAMIRAGLAQVAWPGRLEIIRRDPAVVLDGAHNPPATWALRSALHDLWPDRAIHVVLGVSQDKSTQALGEILGPVATTLTCTKSHHPRARDPEQLAECLKPFHRLCTVIADAADAYTYVLNTAKPEDVIVVTGSLFLVGELRGNASVRRVSQLVSA